MDVFDQHGPIAVVGMSCRFPQASGIEAYWKILVENTDAVTPVPPERFDAAACYAPESGTPGRTVSRHGGFLDDPFAFDAAFFGISPAEARSIDPQQRLLLPVVWEALEAAGILPSALAGSRTGVYIGQATADYADETGPGNEGLKAATGSHIRAMTPGRISYALDLRGPSMVVDTACSSSLTAVHLARQSLLTGESTLAIAGGVNVILSPRDAIAYSHASMLSSDGRCKFGDAAADGFVRSEGAGVVVLKRLQDAERDGDPVLGLLLGSSTTNDGNASGFLLQPSVAGQVAMLREACLDAGTSPDRLDYVEAHGTGTAVGDSVELQALAEVLRTAPPAARAGRRLRTGSVKTNIGHTEAAAGIAGLIKATLILGHGVIPASLHLRTPQPLLAEDRPPVEIVTSNQPLAAAGPQALLGVSSFGLSGTNAHVVIGAHTPSPVPDRAAASAPRADRPPLLVLSARSHTALLRLALAYARYLGPGGPGREHRLEDVCAAAARQRDPHPYRLWAVGSSHDDLAGKLRELADGQDIHDGATADAGFGPERRNVFVFPGQGSQWLGMGRALLKASPGFREALTDCDLQIRKETGWSVLDLLNAPTEEFPDRIEQVQPTLWAMQVALAETWRTMGVEPEVCLGHSMGETAAARVSGALSPADAAAVICRRSRLMQRVAGQGAMLAVELSAAEANRLLREYRGRVCVAVENAPRATVLAGDADALREIGAALNERGVYSRLVKVDVASHSSVMDVLRDDLLAELADLAPRPATVALVSTVRCAPLDGTELDAGYWMDNLREPVRFADSVRLLAKETDNVFVEISPHPLLTTALEDTIADVGAGSAVVASCRRDQDECVELARALGALYARGGRIRWDRWFSSAARHITLPGYPWDEEHLRRPVVRPRPAEHVQDFPQHGPDDGTAPDGPIPSTVYLAAAADAARAATGHGAFSIEDARLSEDLADPAADHGSVLRVRLLDRGDGTHTVRVHALSASATTPAATADDRSTDGAYLSAVLRLLEKGQTPLVAPDLDAALARCRDYLPAAAFQAAAQDRGYRDGPIMRSVIQTWRRDGEAVARVRLPRVPRQAAWEACLQPLLAALPAADPAGSAYLPVFFARVRLLGDLPDEFWSRATFTVEGGSARADIVVSDLDGQLLAEFRGMELRRRTPLGSGHAPWPAALLRLPGLAASAVGALTPSPTAVLSASLRLLDPDGRLREAIGSIPVAPPAPSSEQRTDAVPTPTLPPPTPTPTPTLPPPTLPLLPTPPPTAADPPSASDTLIRHAAQLLGMAAERLDLRRSLHDQGMDSLMAAQLRQRLRADLGREVPLARLLGRDAVGALAASMDI